MPYSPTKHLPSPFSTGLSFLLVKETPHLVTGESGAGATFMTTTRMISRIFLIAAFFSATDKAVARDGAAPAIFEVTAMAQRGTAEQ